MALRTAGLRRAGVALALALLAALGGVGSANARTLTASGSETNRFARILLAFDTPTKVTARASAGVVVLSFPGPVTIKQERLAAELPATIAQVRRDPDGSGLRLALTRPMQVNVLEAGEKVFVDLLPASWTGLPPGLPPEVVDELARRAREAEAKIRTQPAARSAETAKPVTLRVSQLPTLTRLTFETPKGVPVALTTKGDTAELIFGGRLRLVTGEAKGQLAPAVLALRGEAEGDALKVSLALAEGHEARGFREDDSYVLDVTKPKPAQAAEAPADPVQGSTAVAREIVPPPPPPAAPAASPPPPEAVRPSGRAAAPVPPAQPAGPVRPIVTSGEGGVSVLFPFGAPTPAAAFENAGIVTAVFDSPAPIETPAWPEEAGRVADLAGVTREGAMTVIRLALKKEPQPVRLTVQGDGTWSLTLGGRAPAPGDPIPVQRSTDAGGQALVTLPLRGTSGVHWLETPPGAERVAVVTAFGPPRGVARPRRFVEFGLLATAHGVAVAAEADDLVLRADPEGVSISRPDGLAVSVGEGTPDRAAPPDLVLPRESWTRDQLGAVREGERALTLAAAEAPPAGRGQARIALARFLLANGLDHEAAGVLALAGADDSLLAGQRQFELLSGIAQARAGRDADARRKLAQPALADDPEAVLWRAFLDARSKRWSSALAGFRRSGTTLDRYADDLQIAMRSAAAQSALEKKEHLYAEGELAAAAQLAPEGLARDRLALLHARLDEATGRAGAARNAYRALAASAERPVAAEATLRQVALALRENAIEPVAAIAQLETLSVIWRGDDLEVAALEMLARLYADRGRWRDAFTVARRANHLFPDHEVTRALHEDTGRLFEEVFLTGRGDTLARTEALALFFDFKEFTPIGRRGDEIVRRLADRLIELDLLDQAGDLLQHQVEKRLGGAARATVAARLATVRLMAGKPQAALVAIRTTRLPELPSSIKRARILLEARALADLSRVDLALEVLEGEAGREVERLRADIVWNARRWREAGEAHEQLVGLRWQAREALNDGERADVLRAAIAYALGEDDLAQDRLRGKFAAKMADSPDARTFAFLTQPNASSTGAFREIARRATTADTFAGFLAEYRKRYPEAAVAERRRKAAEPEAGNPQAQLAAPAPKS